jgi:hypothetical protein
VIPKQDSWPVLLIEGILDLNTEDLLAGVQVFAPYNCAPASGCRDENQCVPWRKGAPVCEVERIEYKTLRWLDDIECGHSLHKSPGLRSWHSKFTGRNRKNSMRTCVEMTMEERSFSRCRHSLAQYCLSASRESFEYSEKFVSTNSFGIVCILPSPLLGAPPAVPIRQIKHFLKPNSVLRAHGLFDQNAHQLVETHTVFCGVTSGPLEHAVVESNSHVRRGYRVHGLRAKFRPKEGSQVFVGNPLDGPMLISELIPGSQLNSQVTGLSRCFEWNRRARSIRLRSSCSGSSRSRLNQNRSR